MLVVIWNAECWGEIWVSENGNNRRTKMRDLKNYRCLARFFIGAGVGQAL